MKKWKFSMWYYTKKEADKRVSGFKKRGKATKIVRSKNLNVPAGGKYIYEVWYK